MRELMAIEKEEKGFCGWKSKGFLGKRLTNPVTTLSHTLLGVLGSSEWSRRKKLGLLFIPGQPKFISLQNPFLNNGCSGVPLKMDKNLLHGGSIPFQRSL